MCPQHIVNPGLPAAADSSKSDEEGDDPMKDE